jgi:hypothetical protein
MLTLQRDFIVVLSFMHIMYFEFSSITLLIPLASFKAVVSRFHYSVSIHTNELLRSYSTLPRLYPLLLSFLLLLVPTLKQSLTFTLRSFFFLSFYTFVLGLDSVYEKGHAMFAFLSPAFYV